MGGLQRHSFNLAKHLSRLGVEVDLYHTDFSDAEEIDSLAGMTEAEKANINSIAIPWKKGDRLPKHYVRNLKHFSAEAYRRYRQRPAAQFILG
mgnify:FL=1